MACVSRKRPRQRPYSLPAAVGYPGGGGRRGKAAWGEDGRGWDLGARLNPAGAEQRPARSTGQTGSALSPSRIFIVIKFAALTIFKYTTQWHLVRARNWAAITTIWLQIFLTPNRNPVPSCSPPIPHPRPWQPLTSFLSPRIYLFWACHGLRNLPCLAPRI